MLARTSDRCPPHARASYVDRNIQVCAEWRDFDAFQNWAMANGYDDSLTIERIDVNGHYEPANCRWATRSEQSRNCRSNRWITHEGETLLAIDWARKLGLSENLIYTRLHRGIRPPELFSPVPLTHRPRPYMKGEKHWSRHKSASTPRGENHWSTQLTEDQVREIRRRYAAGGIKQKELAAEYAVSKNVVSCIVLRKTFKHI